MTPSVHQLSNDLPLGVLHDSSARLSNAGWKVLHLNDESRDDDANAFPVLSSVSVEREAGAPAAEQFDTGNSVDINIRAGNRLDRISRQLQMAHDNPRCEGRNVPNFGTVEKNAALSFYRLNKTLRAFYRNLKGSTSTSFPIRSRIPTQALPSAAIARSSCSPATPRTYCLLGEKVDARDLKSLGAFPVLVRVQKQAPISQLPPPGTSGVVHRQLASDGFIVVARTFIPARKHALRFDFVENPRTDSAEALPRFVGVSVIDAALHARNNGRGAIRNVGQVFRGENSV